MTQVQNGPLTKPPAYRRKSAFVFLFLPVIVVLIVIPVVFVKLAMAHIPTDLFGSERLAAFGAYDLCI